MPGRNDFSIVRARFMADDRLHDAAKRYVKAKLAVEETAVASVVGHVAMLAIWASRETDDGVLPGDAVGVAAMTMQAPRAVAARSVSALLRAGLLRAVDAGTYLVGFRDCYSGICNKRRRDRERLAKARREKNQRASRRRRARQAAKAAGRPPAVAAARAAPPPSRERKPRDAGPAGPSGRGPPAASSGAPHSTNGRAAALSASDRAVFESLWRRATKGLTPFAGNGASHKDGKWTFEKCPAGDLSRRCRDLRESLFTPLVDAAAVLAFVDELETATPEVTNETRAIRMTKTMAHKSRRRPR